MSNGGREGDLDSFEYYYLQEIGKYSMPKREDEINFGKRWLENEDIDARWQLVLGNLRLSVHVAKDFQGRGLPMEDVIQQGNLGLIRATETFDPEKGKFSNYAARWINQYIRRGLENMSRTIRLPSHVWESISRVKSFEHRVLVREGRKPRMAEFVEETGFSEEKIEYLKRVNDLTFSLDDKTNVRENKLSDAGDKTSSHNVSRRVILQDMIERVLEKLEPREADIVRLRFGIRTNDPMTKEEVAKRYGLTDARIGQIEKGVLGKIREMPDVDELLEFWE